MTFLPTFDSKMNKLDNRLIIVPILFANIEKSARNYSVQHRKNTMLKVQEKKFVLYVRNDECEDLELRKVYQVLPDRKSSQEATCV